MRLPAAIASTNTSRAALAAWMALVVLATLATLGGCSSLAAPRPGRAGLPAASSVAQRWAEDVLLGAEVGADRSRVVRWRRPVRFLVVDAPIGLRAATEAAFAELRDALAGLHRLTLEHVRRDDDRIGTDGYVTVFAIAPAEAADLAQRFGAHAPDQNADGWFTIHWAPSFELVRAIVFISPYLPTDWLRHTALEEMFHSLGPSNDSELCAESVVFEGASSFGRHQHLSADDGRMLRLLYGVLRAGDGRGAIRRAYAPR
ncbi:MAG: DUF2927 domain-containing protein [Planctomycetota bacterium]